MMQRSWPLIFAGLALFLLAVFPPHLAVRESWLGLLCLAAAALTAAPALSRLDRALLWLGAISIGATVLAGAMDALGSLAWLLLGILTFRLGQIHFASPAFRSYLALAGALALIIQALLCVSQWNVVLPGAEHSAAGNIFSSGRIWGAFSTPNLLAAWLLLCIPLFVESALIQKQPARRGAYIATFFLALFLLLMTKSAGAALALAVALLAAAMRFKTQRLLLLLTAGLAALLFTGIAVWRGFTFSDFGDGQSVILRRWILWKPAVSAYLEAPFLGHGPAGARFAYRLACERLGMGYGEYPHQMFLGLLLGYGALGLGCAMAVLAFVWAKIRRSVYSTAADLCLPIAVLAPFLHAQWEMSFQEPAILMVWILLLGGLHGGIRRIAAESPKPIFFRQIWPVAAAVLALAAWRGGLMAWQWPLLGIGIFVLAWFRPPQMPGSKGRVTLMVMAWLGLGFFWSLHPAASLDLWMAMFLLWGAAQSLRYEKTIWIQGAVLVLACVLGVLAIFIPDTHFYFPNQNLLAGAVLAPALLLSAGHFVEKNKFWPWIAPLLLSGFGIMISGSRGALLSLAAGACWLMYRYVRLQPRTVVMGSIVLVIFSAAMLFHPASPLSRRLSRQQIEATADPHFNFRLQIWKASAQAASERWMRGWGLGSYQRVMESRELDLPEGQKRLKLEHAHGSWFEFAVEAGWPAAVLVLVVVLSLFWRWRRDAPASGLAAIEAALLALLVHSLVDFEISTPFCLLLGAVLLAARLPKRSTETIATTPWRWGVALAGAVLLSGSTGVWLEHKLKNQSFPCGDIGFRRVMALRPLDASSYARQAALDFACFDAGVDPRGLARGVRELSVGLDIDPRNRQARMFFAEILERAARALSEDRLVLLGDLVPGWIECSQAFPQLPASKKFLLISEMQLKIASNVQAK